MNAIINQASILIAQEPSKDETYTYSTGIKGIRVDVVGVITITNLDNPTYSAVTMTGVAGEIIPLRGKNVQVVTDGTARVIILL